MPDETVNKSELTGTVLRGFISAVLTMLFLAAAALMMPSSELLQKNTSAAGKGILFLGAFVCGTLCGKKAGKQKLLHAELGGAILIITILFLGAICGTKIELSSVGVDILITAFGSFASMLLTPGKKNRAGKKKKYRR